VNLIDSVSQQNETVRFEHHVGVCVQSLPTLRQHSHWYKYRLRVIHTSKIPWISCESLF